MAAAESRCTRRRVRRTQRRVDEPVGLLGRANFIASVSANTGETTTRRPASAFTRLSSLPGMNRLKIISRDRTGLHSSSTRTAPPPSTTRIPSRRSGADHDAAVTAAGGACAGPTTPACRRSCSTTGRSAAAPREPRPVPSGVTGEGAPREHHPAPQTTAPRDARVAFAAAARRCARRSSRPSPRGAAPFRPSI